MNDSSVYTGSGGGIQVILGSCFVASVQVTIALNICKAENLLFIAKNTSMKCILLLHC